MYSQFRSNQFETYNFAKSYLIENYERLIQLENYLTETIRQTIIDNLEDIKTDYNEASYLYPFWQNYPPEERGRAPRGDQYPWIEVGEHSVGNRISNILSNNFIARHTGLPAGADQRLVISNDTIQSIIGLEKSSAFLFMDIKSVGRRDDSDHAVMSHNQISGNGVWSQLETGITNDVLVAKGKIASHNFHCSLPPLYVLSDNTIAPMINIIIKPVYSMNNDGGGQPLERITIACIPNGILLTLNPGYIKNYPSLLFPGKDKKDKNPLKWRARVDFKLLRLIDDWRVSSIYVD